MGHADTLIAMGGAFVAAAVLARLGARIGLPTIPLFILAGILLGSHTPGFVLLDDVEDLEMLAALGLVLLLFYLGLEFHLDDLRAGGRRMAVAGAMYLVLNVGAGLAFGLALGWGTAEAFVLAGVLGISSSAIVTKILVDLRRIGNPETTPILGIIVVEDLFLAMYLAALQPVITGGGDAGETALQIGRAFVFLLALAVAARWGVRLIGRLFRLGDDELLVISFLGAAVLVAGIAELFGVADAIGAFMVGLILGSTDSGERIRKLVHPLRDAFAAIFFFTFGLSIDPRDLPSVLVPVLLAVLVTLTMNVSAGLFTSRLYGFGRLRTANVATTLLARGEFALILATMAAQAGLDERLSPFIAGYVLILAIVAPLVAGRSHWLARVLPRSGPTPDAASAHRAPPGVAEDAAPPVRPPGPAERTGQGGPGDPADPAAVPGTGAPGPYAPDPYAPVADATAHSPPPPDGPEPDPHADGHRPHHFPETEYTAPRLPAPDGHHPHSPDRDADHLHTPDRDRDPDGRPNPDHRHPDRDRERAPNPDHDHGHRLDLDPDHT